MNYCQFHPLNPATWHCPQCMYDACDCCTDEGIYNDDHRCMVCNTPVRSLGSANTAIPFWRHLEESFRYPMKADAIVLIVTVALLNILASFLPVGPIIQILLYSVIFSYSFQCMRQTARGNMTIPDINSTYGQGMPLIIRFFISITVIDLVITYSGEILGNGIGQLISFIILLSIPAMIILYGLSESLLETLNPLSIYKLIVTIGLPYGLIPGFILIMDSSVMILQELFSSVPLFSSLLQEMTSNYYIIVMFNIMGYMIFQNQEKLGFTARESHGVSIKGRSEDERLQCHLQVLLKDGRFEEMIDTYEKAILKNPENKSLAEDCFKLLIAIHNNDYLHSFASFYLELLIKNKHFDQLCGVYKRITLIIPEYLPDTAEIRHTLANAMHERGDFKVAVKLLNGLHQAFPEYKETGKAYALMAECLDNIPDMQAQAEQYREFSLKLQKPE
jgi:hypothetical protein